VKSGRSTAPAVPILEEADRFEIAVDHTWNWFSLHSGQRMQLVNFLILSLTVITAAYGASMNLKRFGVACGIALAGIVLAVLFRRLDLRTRELVQACEPALQQIEERLSAETGVDVRFAALVQRPGRRIKTYRETLRSLTVLAVVFFAAGAVYAFVKTGVL
jgi:Flp pilus assembly protein TadB